MGGDWFKKTSVMKFFPAVVADLDYRIMYQNAGIIIYLNEHYAITLPFTNYKERVNRLFYYMVY